MLNRTMALWQQDRQNLPLTLQVIDQLFDSRDWAAVNDFFDQIPDDNRQQPEICAKWIDVLICQNQLNDATIQAKKLCQITDEHPLALHYFTLTHYLVGDLQALLILAKRPNLTPETVILLARAWYHQGQLTQAIDSLLPIQSAEAWGLLAMLYLDTDQLDLAIELATQALALQPNQVDALLAKASYSVVLQQMDNAKPVIDQLLLIQPHSGRALSILGQIQFFEFNTNAAINTFTQAVKFMPNHIGTWHLLAWSYFIQAQWQQATEAFESALLLDRNFAESHGGLAVMAATQGDHGKAEQLAKVALRLNPQSFAGLYARSLIAGQSGQQDKATLIVEGILAKSSHLSGLSYRQLVDSAVKTRQAKG